MAGPCCFLTIKGGTALILLDSSGTLMGTEVGDWWGWGHATNIFLLFVQKLDQFFSLQHIYNHGAGFEACIQLLKETRNCRTYSQVLWLFVPGAQVLEFPDFEWMHTGMACCICLWLKTLKELPWRVSFFIYMSTANSQATWQWKSTAIPGACDLMYNIRW